MKDVLFSYGTGDFDASELSDGEQSQVCSYSFSLHSISVFYVAQFVFIEKYLKKTWVVKLKRQMLKIGFFKNVFFSFAFELHFIFIHFQSRTGLAVIHRI